MLCFKGFRGSSAGAVPLNVLNILLPCLGIVPANPPPTEAGEHASDGLQGASAAGHALHLSSDNGLLSDQDGSFDTVVDTFGICSFEQPIQVEAKFTANPPSSHSGCLVVVLRGIARDAPGCQRRRPGATPT